MIGKLNCLRIEQSLWDYSAGHLDDVDVDRVDAHLSRCAGCRRRAASYNAAVLAAKQLRRVEVPQSERTWWELRATLEGDSARAAVASGIRTRRGTAGLAGAVVTAAALLIVMQTRGLAPRTNPTDVRGAKSGKQIALGTPDPRTAIDSQTIVFPHTSSHVSSVPAVVDHRVHAPSVVTGTVATATHFESPRVHHTPVVGSWHWHNHGNRQPASQLTRMTNHPSPRRQPAMMLASLDGASPSQAPTQYEYVMTPATTDAASEYVIGGVGSQAQASTASYRDSGGEDRTVW